MKTKDMVLISLFAIITSIGGIITIPTPIVPITLQLTCSLLSGILLGGRRGAMSQALYIVMGLIGLPVFSGGTGGLQAIISPTFGYIIGFIFASYIVGKAAEKHLGKGNIFKIVLGGILGIIVSYTIGTIYLYGVMNIVIKSPTSIVKAIQIGVLPFLLKDIILAGVTVFAGEKIAGRIGIKEFSVNE